ncbi:MAG: uroporphyrinogen decarboxylase [Hyphomicrobiaceae bacterium]|nr:uroporphyrinogen decarboxylase [Hyphomicrobiaceae bacterium]
MLNLNNESSSGIFLNTLSGQNTQITPIWLMRQAGRYLPEYRSIRMQASGFLNLCYTPDLAVEVTLQPIRRYDFDAAILFSDILVVPHALGQQIEFVEGDGPILDPIQNAHDLSKLNLDRVNDKFLVICETVKKIRKALSKEKALIGFCGAPWTVATYSIAGRSTLDQAPARLFAYKDPQTFASLIDLLTETSINYLSQQIEAGVDAVQLFDSWAGVLPDKEFDRWVVQPTKKIVSTLKSLYPSIPIIGFPKAAGIKTIQYVLETGVQALGCDSSLPLSFMRNKLASKNIVLQGNLDPLLLVAGGKAMENRINQILEIMRDKPFIFNLGHGIVPMTPPENVAHLVETVRSFK